MAVHKKSVSAETSPQKRNPAEAEQKKTVKEPVVVSDVITKTTETIEVIEEVPASQSSAADPLSDFKEKMSEEENMPPTSSKKNYMWPILFIFIAALVLLAGIFAYRQGIFKGGKTSVVSPSPTPTITSEPTKIAVDLSKYEIEIQNGSEVAGEAGRQKASLEEEGFKISAIGNANNSDYTDTIIKAKKEVEKAFLDKLKSVLEKTFTVGEIRILPDSSSSSVVVIIGTKK